MILYPPFLGASTTVASWFHFRFHGFVYPDPDPTGNAGPSRARPRGWTSRGRGTGSGAASWAAGEVWSCTIFNRFHYPVVNGGSELRSYGYSNSLLNEERAKELSRVSKPHTRIHRFQSFFGIQWSLLFAN